ncbi:MAG: hypothetical protein IT536_06425 [Hyphomicrobiales bacterium]|nr:hypothetical protein [Hyphomicrobiales bacterium]
MTSDTADRLLQRRGHDLGGEVVRRTYRQPKLVKGPRLTAVSAVLVVSGPVPNPE